MSETTRRRAQYRRLAYRLESWMRVRLWAQVLAGLVLGVFAGLLLGFVDPGNLSVKDAYIGVFVGGLLLGAGFAVAGFCPGTGLTAAATGRMDALVFTIGGLVGAALYMGSYAWVQSTGILEKVAGGKATLGPIEGTDYPALLGMSGEWIGLVLGVAFIAIAAVLPSRLIGARGAAAPAE